LSAAEPSPPVLVRDRGGVREIRLSRPDRHNALDEETIARLTAAFQDVVVAPIPPRAVLLTAEGKSFCAGADVDSMRRMGQCPPEENLEGARRLAGLFRSVRTCPCLVLARVQGAALGGGSGLVATCDLVVAAEEARFGFTEVRLGIVPATISPFVIERIGSVRARALFATGEIFGAAEAQRIGLVDRVLPLEELDHEIDRVLGAILGAAPLASREAKRLADEIGRRLSGDAGGGSAPCLEPSLAEETARRIAAMRSGPEGREGLTAFLEKRRPTWVEPWPPADLPRTPPGPSSGPGQTP
jgi:methylglutaconyl-CoA hydratase